MIWGRLRLFSLLRCPHFTAYKHQENKWHLMAKFIPIFMRTRLHIQIESMLSLYYSLCQCQYGRALNTVSVKWWMHFRYFCLNRRRYIFHFRRSYSKSDVRGWPHSMHGILMDWIMIFQCMFFLATHLSFTRSKNGKLWFSISIIFNLLRSQSESRLLTSLSVKQWMYSWLDRIWVRFCNVIHSDWIIAKINQHPHH